jgi:uncharacterized protein YggU (UPF0235/DUF167 family)
VDGKANLHLIEFLAEVFGVQRARVALIQGAGGKIKVFRITAPAVLPHGLDLEQGT